MPVLREPEMHSRDGGAEGDVHGMPTVEGEHEWLCFTGDGTAIVGRGATWEDT